MSDPPQRITQPPFVPSMPETPQPQIIQPRPERPQARLVVSSGLPPELPRSLHPSLQQSFFAPPLIGRTLPVILKGAILTFDSETSEGQLVAAVGGAWLRILEFLVREPDAVLQMSPRDWEQFIAGCYDSDGYSVTLTPPSGDYGRDVIAEKPGVGTIRVLDQVKRYKPGHLVTAEEVRAFLFVAQADKATKGFITTTSDFAPRLLDDPFIAPLVSSGFLEPRPREKTLAWLKDLSKRTT
jgi:restriction system protein